MPKKTRICWKLFFCLPEFTGDSTMLSNTGSGLLRSASRSTRSLLSTLSDDSNVTVRHIQNNSDREKGKSMVKLLVAMGVPILCLVVVTSIAFHDEQTLYAQVTETQDTLSDCIVVSNLIGALQKERGVSALYVSTPDIKVFQKLSMLRGLTDDLLASFQSTKFEIEFALTIDGDEHLATYENLPSLIQLHRDGIVNGTLNSVQNIELYTSIVSGLIGAIITHVVVNVAEDVWKDFASIVRFILASDTAGIQRAIGSIYFSKCFIPGKGILWMVELNIKEEIHIKSALQYSSEHLKYGNDFFYGNNSLMTEINLLKNEIMNGDGWRCQNTTEVEKLDTALLWFDSMTDYIDVLFEIQRKKIENIVESLNVIHRAIITKFALYVTVIAVVLLGSLVLSVWYVKSINALTDSLKLYTRKMSTQTKDIAKEKVTTEKLLYRLLPKHVAEQLKQNRPVDAEYFTSVTIYFSDIVGFTAISAACTPHQVVDLLNQIYHTFDSIIDQYDVYKVETIGDAYMVASGLPERNGIQHAKQIAMMSLELLPAIQCVETPSGKNIQLRTGIHSGSVVAGVVGIKMPRYCLFGDTVSIASAMEHTGKASAIHISEVTNSLMNKCGRFRSEYRGKIQTLVKGTIETFWLLEALNPEVLEAKPEYTFIQPFTEA